MARDTWRLTRRQATVCLACALAAPRSAGAGKTWPTQPIKLVVPFTPGGSTDLLARLIGRRMEALLGQPIVVENRPGAGGSVAASAVARSEPDGHTLLMGHIGTLAFNPTLYSNLPYNPLTDFAAVARVATLPNVLVVHPSLPARSPGELIAYARTHPGKLNYGSGGNGSAAHIATAYFAHAAGIELVHVPYRGTAPAVSDLVGNHIQLMMTGGPAVLPLAAAGQLRALAVSSASRAPFAPELPTVAESAVPGFEANQWYGIVAPARTPGGIVTRLNQLVNAQLSTPELATALAKEGAIAAAGTPEEFASLIASEITAWRDIIRRANIRISK